MDHVTETFSKRLKELRNGESQEIAAKNIGISRGALSYYESGERKPDINILYSIAKYYGVSTDYLLGLSDTKQMNIENNTISKKLGLSSHSIEHLNLLKNSIDTTPISVDSDETNYEQKLYREIELYTINLLIGGYNDLLSTICTYLFLHFSHFTDFYNDDAGYTPIDHLELFDARLNLSFSEDYDLFSNALLLEIQKQLMYLREEHSGLLASLVNYKDDIKTPEDAYNIIHKIISSDLLKHRL